MCSQPIITSLQSPFRDENSTQKPRTHNHKFLPAQWCRCTLHWEHYCTRIIRWTTPEAEVIKWLCTNPPGLTGAGFWKWLTLSKFDELEKKRFIAFEKYLINHFRMLVQRCTTWNFRISLTIPPSCIIKEPIFVPTRFRWSVQEGCGSANRIGKRLFSNGWSNFAHVYRTDSA